MDNEKKHNQDQVLHILNHLQFKFRRKRTQQRRPRECHETKGKQEKGMSETKNWDQTPSSQANADLPAEHKLYQIRNI